MKRATSRSLQRPASPVGRDDEPRPGASSASPTATAAAFEAGTEPSAPLLEEARLVELLDLDEDGDALRSITAIFLAEAPARIDRLDRAITNDDPDAARSAAHSLSGSAGVVGAARLRALAAAIEQDARAGRLPASSAADDLRAVLGETASAFERRLAELG